MIWLTWRQQRFEAALAAVVIALGIGVLVLTRQAIIADINALGIPDCLRGLGDNNACSNAYQAFKDNFASQQPLLGALTYLPVLVGVVLAASVAVEMEQGTYRLAWAQSVTRERWMLTRFGLPLLFGIAITGLVAAITSWWMQPANQVQGALRPGSFDVQGLLPPAYMVLAFAITVAAGVVLRRTVPAVGLGMVAGIGTHLAVQFWLRANFVAPMSSVWMSGAAPYGPRDWVVQGGAGASSYLYVDSAGRQLSYEQVQAVCGQVTDAQSKGAWSSCLQAHHLGELVRWQAPTRFWELQSIETALVVGIALALLLVTVWWLRRRTV
ncbi:MAG TPA: hypothetical protein VGS16_05575 [Candidatus Dormibacteraeota bacterium]|nr:hypothetical protein [Candidatus Dormibacteraeota bacterium]